MFSPAQGNGDEDEQSWEQGEAALAPETAASASAPRARPTAPSARQVPTPPPPPERLDLGLLLNAVKACVQIMQGFVRQFTLLQDEVREMQEYLSATAAQAPDTDGEPEPLDEPDPELMGIEDAQSALAQEPARAQGPSRSSQVEHYARDLHEWEERMMRDAWRRRRNRARDSRSRSRSRRRNRSRDRRRRRDSGASEDNS